MPQGYVGWGMISEDLRQRYRAWAGDCILKQPYASEEEAGRLSIVGHGKQWTVLTGLGQFEVASGWFHMMPSAASVSAPAGGGI